MHEVAFTHISVRELLCAEAIYTGGAEVRYPTAPVPAARTKQRPQPAPHTFAPTPFLLAQPASKLLDALWLRPVEWDARWSSVLRFGLQLGPAFGRALARVQGVDFGPPADAQTALCIAWATSLAHHHAPDEEAAQPSAKPPSLSSPSSPLATAAAPPGDALGSDSAAVAVIAWPPAAPPARAYQTVGLRALALLLRLAPHLRTVKMHVVLLPLHALLGLDDDGNDDATARATPPVVEPRGNGGSGGNRGDGGDAGNEGEGDERDEGAHEAEEGQGRVGCEEGKQGGEGEGCEEGAGVEGSAASVTALPPVCTPEAIELAGAGLISCDARLIAELLRSNRRLTSLRLPRNAIAGLGAAGLASLLGDASCPPRLRLLDLCSNQLGCDGAVALAHALRRNTSLAELLLSGNGTPSPRAPLRHRIPTHPPSLTSCTPLPASTPLHPALPLHHLCTTPTPLLQYPCTTLASLHLIAAGIGKRGGLALGHAMSTSATLQACTVAACALPVQALRGAAAPSAAAEAAEAVELGQRLLTEVDALLIGAMLAANTTMRRLALHGNALCGVRDGWGAFDSCGLRALAAGLGANTALLALDLSENALCGVEAYYSGAQGNTAAGAEPLRLECVQALHVVL